MVGFLLCKQCRWIESDPGHCVTTPVRVLTPGFCQESNVKLIIVIPGWVLSCHHSFWLVIYSLVVSDLMSGLVSCWCLVELIVWIVIVLFSCWVFLLFLLLKWQETSVRRCASANGTSGNKPLRVSGSNSFHAKTFANSFFLINSYSLLRCHRLFPLSISTSSVQDINVAVVIIIITIVIMYVYNILYSVYMYV